MIDTYSTPEANCCVFEPTEAHIVEYESLSLHDGQASRNANVVRKFLRKHSVFSLHSIRTYLFEEKRAGFVGGFCVALARPVPNWLIALLGSTPKVAIMCLKS